MCLIADVYDIRELAFILLLLFTLPSLNTLDAPGFFSSSHFSCHFERRFYLKVPRCDLFGLVRIIYDTLWN